MTIIYGLLDPRTSELRYIGKTQRAIKERLKEHRNIAQGGRKALHQWCANWLRSLYAQGLAPDLQEFERVRGDWVESEKFWIAYWRFLGANLTNHTDGGDGLAGMKRPSHVIEKSRAAHRGSKRTEEAKARMRAAWSAERRAANGARLRGSTMSEDAREKMSISGRKRFRSQEERNACRERLAKFHDTMTAEQLLEFRRQAGLKGGRPPKAKATA